MRGQVDQYLYSCIVNNEDKDIGEERTERRKEGKKGRGEGKKGRRRRRRKKWGRKEGKEKRLNDSA